MSRFGLRESDDDGSLNEQELVECEGGVDWFFGGHDGSTGFCYRDEAVPKGMDPAVPIFLGTLGSPEISVLNDPAIFTPDTCREGEMHMRTSQGAIDGKAVDEGEIIFFLHDVDRVELKRYVSSYEVDLEKWRSDYSEEKFVKLCRCVRDCQPSGNKLSKRAYTIGESTSYEKFRFPAVWGKPAIFYGNKDCGDLAFLIKGVRACFDIESVGGGVGDEVKVCVKKTKTSVSGCRTTKTFFQTGNIEDWKEHVKAFPGVKVIYSDVVGGDGFGMKWMDGLDEIYQEMVDAGYDVVYANHVLVSPVSKLCSFRKMRPHNYEVILHCNGKGAVMSAKYPSFEKWKEKIVDVNYNRTNDMLHRDLEFLWESAELWKNDIVVPDNAISKRAGVKRRILNRYRDNRVSGYLVDKYLELCMDPDPVLLPFAGCSIDVEFPLIFTDFPLVVANYRQVFQSLLDCARKQKRELYFDKEYGWVAC